MAIDVTYTFTPMTIIASSEVNQNFTDLRDSLRGAHHQDADGTLLVNADVDAAAAIAYSKLNLSSSIVDADINASAAIQESKILFDGTSGHDHSGGTSGKAIDPSDLDGVSANVTATNLNTLTGAGDASALHTHDGNLLVLTYSVGMATNSIAGGDNARVGYNDDSSDRCISMLGQHEGSAGERLYAKLGIATDVGSSLYLTRRDNHTGTLTATLLGVVHIGTDRWTSYSTSTIRKNNSNVTISGGSGTQAGKLGYDPTNSYLLVMVSTTEIKRYSGVGGTTLTYVDTITLDTACDNDIGFAFDDDNTQYFAVDSTNGVIREFDSSGTTVSTQAYTFDESQAEGVVIVDDRIYVAFATSAGAPGGSVGERSGTIHMNLVPTDMTR